MCLNVKVHPFNNFKKLLSFLLCLAFECLQLFVNAFSCVKRIELTPVEITLLYFKRCLHTTKSSGSRFIFLSCIVSLNMDPDPLLDNKIESIQHTFLFSGMCDINKVVLHYLYRHDIIKEDVNNCVIISSVTSMGVVYLDHQGAQ